MHGLTELLVALVGVTTSLAASIPKDAPTIKLDKGTFVGVHNGSADVFLGIPYAQPPVGNLRYRQPVEVEPYSGVYNATQFGFSCPGIEDPPPSGIFEDTLDDLLDAKFPGLQNSTQPQNEDCLTANVWIPKGAKKGDKYPVVLWLHLGAFVYGGSSSYNGGFVVERSIENGTPVIYSSPDEPPPAFGFLPGKEAQAAGITNLGMRDQRQALRWIQKYIESFGGDPSRVTIWGVNAGSESAACQMLTNNGDTEGLFSGAVMQSGFPLPLNNYTQLQSTYDALVNATNCTTASDTLDCLRELPFETLYNGMINLPLEQRTSGWQLILDFDFIPDQPPTLLMEGKVAKVPFIMGDTDDEGTETSLFFTSTITTDDELFSYVQNELVPGISNESTTQILELYPADPSAGSPFDTGTANAITPEFKRLSAIIGDLEFHGQRRFFLNQTAHLMPAYTWLSKLYKDIPFVGSGTVTDDLNLYGPGALTDYLINFVALGTPNNGTGLVWPKWTKSSPNILTLVNNTETPLLITDDTFRSEGINLLIALNLQHPE
ncbi:alpha/beta-hydrolase [Obba rivulosa]|uniref:Alpha/beta-hydrolase n=1 Tax=Obba rivulosa TaxID=1052685 RepID=A0A8E2DNA4_9APHY|nr:alpha/beta-hydrolase [Obba rivulosa]